MLTDQQIKEVLIKQQYLSAEELEKAEKKAVDHHSGFVETLIDDGLINPELLFKATAEYFHVDYISLTREAPTRDQIKKIPEELARKYNLVVAAFDDDKVTIATDDPGQKEIMKELSVIFPKKEIVIGYAPIEFIEATFIHYKKPLDTRFNALVNSIEEGGPEIFDEIVSDAILLHASDIHFEPNEKNIEVRFRVDGVLHEAGFVPKEIYENILNKVKNESRLRIDKHRTPQDGAMRYEKGSHRFDLRVSIIPILEGEKIAIRVLGSYFGTYSFHEIGLSRVHENILKKSAAKPFGMILAVGPTSSGKTTTLYALVKMLNSPDVNITTIEDPIEYKIEGINQIQVDLRSGLTFASALRTIVRQDPDIILVGEIRDNETAEISVNSALSGHLLLSTFHSNDAATALPRLLDMGVEPFLLASALELVISQRLARRLCEHCRYAVSLSAEELGRRFPIVRHFFKENLTLYESKGCESCYHTGFFGRVALVEMIEITPELKVLILKNPSTKQIWELARTQGSRSLFEDGIDKVKIGLTSLPELLRVATPPIDI